MRSIKLHGDSEAPGPKKPASHVRRNERKGSKENYETDTSAFFFLLRQIHNSVGLCVAGCAHHHITKPLTTPTTATPPARLFAYGGSPHVLAAVAPPASQSQKAFTASATSGITNAHLDVSTVVVGFCPPTQTSACGIHIVASGGGATAAVATAAGV